MINNRTLYAIEALCELARSKDYFSKAHSIAESTGVPKKFMPQILSDLSRAGLVRSIRGYGGGVSLVQPPKKVSLLQIIEAMQNNLFIYDQLIGQQDISKGMSDNLLKAFKKIQDVTKTEWAKVSLADLAAKPRGKKKGKSKI
ncbi:MAG: Rrf2 family transcriptional regulator [candidate division Zixibacteria bacterium]|nr:Rrf2 family transcriptional regulator [candidate division Zixibacteria bacterium]